MKPCEIKRIQTQANQVDITLYLDHALFWFQGHFAVQPLLPGVAQIDWVMYYTRLLFAPDSHFHSIPSVKFQAPLFPGNTITLTLNWHEDSQLLTFKYQRHDGNARHTASSGKIRLWR